MNFDGSVHPNHKAAAGFVVREWNGNAMAKNLGFTEILVAEAIALRDGLLVIPHLAPTNLIVEGDSKALIDAINGRIDIPSLIKILVRDIRIIASRFSMWLIL